MPATGDLELGDMSMIQRGVHGLLDLLDRVKCGDIPAPIPQYPPNILMAPNKLRDLSPHSFDPRLVAIGPLHKKDEKLQYYEKVMKPNYLNKLMSRISSPQEEILKSCMQKVYFSMRRIKSCYAWVDTTYSDDEMAEMMVIDACFILEFLYHSSQDEVPNYQHLVWRDLVLLENQIPFFVLDEIYQRTITKIDLEASLLKLLNPIIISGCFVEAENIKINTFFRHNTLHILDLMHECFKPSDDISTVSVPPTIRSVVDLDSGGVMLKPNHNPTWPLGMKVETYWFLCFFQYWCKPTLRIPRLFVRRDTETILFNLIAYEQSRNGTHSYITSYVVAMDMLVKTQEDVAMLVDSKVIGNYVGSDEQVAHIINNVCKGVEEKIFVYNEQWEAVSKYWKSNVAWLRRTYFNSPWNMIALFAGIILFFLTVVQTIFTINPAK